MFALHRNYLIIIIVICLSQSQVILVADANKGEKDELSIAENIYVKISNACRALMDFNFPKVHEQEAEAIKTMKIVHLLGKTTRIMGIDEAFASLSQPSLFDIRKQTKIVMHGYNDNPQSSVPLDIANAYNEKGIFNVLLVDAEELFSQGYIKSAHNTRIVGRRLANFLANLENYGASAEDMHIVGISLGAQVAGITGKYFRKYKGKKIGRITGLDPAGPCFTYGDIDTRLDKNDATFVDVVHANRLVQGVLEPVGHADFYLNGGGPNQPGCFTPQCSHLRAAQVYAESIRRPKAFVGIECKNWKHFEADSCEDKLAVLGYGSSPSSRGVFYLRTATRTPYGIGMEGIKPKVVRPLDDNFDIT